jgi:hypothetical protein
MLYLNFLIMTPKKNFDFQIAVERPIGGVYGDRQDQIFPESNQYMSFDFEDVLGLVETGAKVYTSTTAQQTAASNAAAAQANLQAQQAAILAAAQKSATPTNTSSSFPKWAIWSIVGVLGVGAIVTTIVVLKK